MLSLEKPILLPTPRHVDMSGGYIDLEPGPLTVSGVDRGMVEVKLNIPPFNSLPGNRRGESSRNSHGNRVGLHGSIPQLVANSYPSKVRCEIDPHQLAASTNIKPSDDEGYTLKISPQINPHDSLIDVTAASEKGLRYGLYTLGQLLYQYNRHLPCLEIEDYPSFTTRGIMLDISRDRVPTLDELFRIVNLLAGWKINHLQLYTEHTFAYNGHEVVWRKASPVTSDEIRRLDRHCRDNGITLAANQNCFGHMQRWLEHDAYAHLAEIHDDWDFNGHPRRGPFSLCPVDPGSIRLVDDLLDQLLPNFSSNLVNIGCDETFDVGQGRSRSLVEKSGFTKVYSDFVGQVADSARRHGLRSMFWADIALSHPEALNQLPKDMIALAWGYEPDAPFADWGYILQGTGFEYWVCPGTSSWRSITGRTNERRGNLIAAVRQGLSGGAQGFLITDWGDMGHRQQWCVSLHALAEAANAAWNADAADRFDTRASAWFAFGEENGSIAMWLDELGNADLELRRISGQLDRDGSPTPLRNASCLFNDLHTPLYEAVKTDDLAFWKRILDRILNLETNFPQVSDVQVKDELRHTLEVAKLAAERAVARRTIGGLTKEVRRDLRKRLHNIIAEHRRLWQLHSRPGGLDDSCGYYETIMNEL